MATRPCTAFRSVKSVPFVLFRSGTSRGAYVLESDVPEKGPARDEALCKIMGSGHPEQLEGFGGGTGPTSKAVIVGAGANGGVTYTFAQCRVKESSVDHSHGDCGNMLAAVGPFALERGLVPLPNGDDGAASVSITSLNTGAIYEAEVLLERLSDGGTAIRYGGDCVIAGVPSPAAPVVLTTFGVAGSQTGKLLPTARATDTFDLGEGLGEVTASIVDFARALIILDAGEVLPHFGYASMADATKQRVGADAALNAALERVRRQASLAMGMGDCAGKDSPKLAIIGPVRAGADAIDSAAGMLECRYFVNPERCEMHASIAMTAAQAIGAACLVSGSIAMRAMGAAPAALGGSRGDFTFGIVHEQGTFPVSVTTSVECDEAEQALFLLGKPVAAQYTTTVMPVAEGRAFL